jgi:hypothetical protein
MFPLRATSLSIVLAIVLAPQIAGAQGLPTISTRTDRPSARAAATSGRPLASVIENGHECTTVTFEGLANQAAVPPISGINFAGWLSLIDADAGGTGNFANEPSPETSCSGSGLNPSISLDTPASKVEFYYSTSVTAHGHGVRQRQRADRPDLTCAELEPGQAVTPPDSTTAGTPLTIEVPGSQDQALSVIGGPNYTGFDNLKDLHSMKVDSVELTQAIQQWQSLDDLKADLQGDREPPVPIVAGKPAALRVYFEKVDRCHAGHGRGLRRRERRAEHGPPAALHGREAAPRTRTGALSVDFYFTPARGQLRHHREVRDGSGTVVDTHELPFTARATNNAQTESRVHLRRCGTASGSWLCAAAGDLDGSRGRAAQDRADAIGGRRNDREPGQAADLVARHHRRLVGCRHWRCREPARHLRLGLGCVIGTTVKYYGMIRPALPGGTGGMASDIGSDGAGSRTSVDAPWRRDER